MPVDARYPFVPGLPPLHHSAFVLIGERHVLQPQMFSARSVQHFLSSVCPFMYCGFLSVSMERMQCGVPVITFQQELDGTLPIGYLSHTMGLHLLLSPRLKENLPTWQRSLLFLSCIPLGRERQYWRLAGCNLSAYFCQFTSRLAIVDSLFQLSLDSVG